MSLSIAKHCARGSTSFVESSQSDHLRFHNIGCTSNVLRLFSYIADKIATISLLVIERPSCYPTTGRGKLIRNVQPEPGVLSTEISPLARSTARLAIASPSPKPSASPRFAPR